MINIEYLSQQANVTKIIVNPNLIVEAEKDMREIRNKIFQLVNSIRDYKEINLESFQYGVLLDYLQIISYLFCATKQKAFPKTYFLANGKKFWLRWEKPILNKDNDSFEDHVEITLLFTTNDDSDSFDLAKVIKANEYVGGSISLEFFDSRLGNKLSDRTGSIYCSGLTKLQLANYVGNILDIFF